MRCTNVMVGILVVSSVAGAKPLPAGMKATLKLGRPYLQQGATSVPLRDDDIADYEKILKAELAPDGKTVVVTAQRCAGSLAADETTLPLAKIQARFDNAAGLVALGKKQYAQAMTKLASAMQKDPDVAAYATNLLAAQVLGKKLDVAAQTLAIQGTRNPAWFAWQLATDPQLAAIKDHKRAKALLAEKPGTATVEKLGDRDLATTDTGGGMAALHTSSVGAPPPPPPPPPTPAALKAAAKAAATPTPAAPADAAPPAAPARTVPPRTSDVDIVSLATGKLLARLPIITLDDACDETDQAPCSDVVAARIAERRRVANALLASLGFAIQPGAFIDVRNGDPVHGSGLTVEFADDGITATRGGDEKSLATDASPSAIAFTPKAIVVRLDRRHLYTCDDASSRVYGAVLPL